MNRWEKAERWILYSTATLVCLVLVSFWMTCNMYARYTSEASGSDSARVAAFCFDLSDAENPQMIDVENIKKPGDTAAYTFTVTNKKQSMISEVSTSYTVAVAVTGSVPLKCEITKANNSTAICSATNINDGSSTATSPAVQMKAGEESTATYTISVEWPSTYNDEVYASASGVGQVKLTVHAEQID